MCWMWGGEAAATIQAGCAIIDTWRGHVVIECVYEVVKVGVEGKYDLT